MQKFSMEQPTKGFLFQTSYQGEGEAGALAPEAGITEAEKI